MYQETRKGPRPLRGCQSHCFHAGCQRKAMLGFLPCSFLMLWWWHALTSSSGSVPCCAWLCANAAAWREALTVPFAGCGHHKGNVLRIVFPSRKYYHSCGCLERNVSTRKGCSESGNNINDHVRSVQVVRYECIQAFIEKLNTALWKQISSASNAIGQHYEIHVEIFKTSATRMGKILNNFLSLI